MLSKRSLEKLATCHADLQRVVVLAATRARLGVSCGHRGEVDQRAAFINKFSKADWPDSPHNDTPSRAVDLFPIPLDWNDYGAFERMAKIVLMCADELGVALTWGGNFKGKFKDRPHFELA